MLLVGGGLWWVDRLPLPLLTHFMSDWIQAMARTIDYDYDCRRGQGNLRVATIYFNQLLSVSVPRLEGKNSQVFDDVPQGKEGKSDEKTEGAPEI